MTTAAWDLFAGILCIDGRVLVETEIETDHASKRITKAGRQFFIIGTVGDLEEMADAYLAGSHKLRKSIDSEMLIIDGSKLIEASASEGDISWHPVSAKRSALGSGAQWAKAALAQDATPQEAIRAAKKKDSGTGGRVRTYTIRGHGK